MLYEVITILTVQSLFFADGGILALGCNIFNLGFFPAFVAYPFIFRKIVNSVKANCWLLKFISNF